jgi:hypothetical protein
MQTERVLKRGKEEERETERGGREYISKTGLYWEKKERRTKSRRKDPTKQAEHNKQVRIQVVIWPKRERNAEQIFLYRGLARLGARHKTNAAKTETALEKQRDRKRAYLVRIVAE